MKYCVAKEWRNRDPTRFVAEEYDWRKLTCTISRGTRAHESVQIPNFEETKW